MPRDWSSPIMAGDHRRFMAQGIKQSDHIADQMKKGVLVNTLWPICLAVAAHIGGHSMETCCSQR